MQAWLEIASIHTFRGNGDRNTRTEEQLHSFEADNGIILPTEYKNFCKVFGSGVFGHYLTIYSPEFEQVYVNYLRMELEDSVGIEDSELGYRLRDGETLPVEAIRRILDSAFIFGGASNAELFFWDLQTYDPHDESYDIYITRVEDFPGIYLVGRNFLEFIQTFGRGNGSYGSLPEWAQPRIEDLTGTFTPISWQQQDLSRFR